MGRKRSGGRFGKFIDKIYLSHKICFTKPTERYWIREFPSPKYSFCSCEHVFIFVPFIWGQSTI